MGCWSLGLCVQGGGAKAVTPVRRWGAWGRERKLKEVGVSWLVIAVFIFGGS